MFLLSLLCMSILACICYLSFRDSRPIRRHPDFRLFCCMNPVTDIGKKSLPPSLRDRFTEFYVDELKDNSDLRTLVTRYLSESNIPPLTINGVIKCVLYSSYNYCFLFALIT